MHAHLFCPTECSCYARLAVPDAARPIAPELARAGSAPAWAAGLALAAEILAAESRSASAGSPPSANAASTCARVRQRLLTCMPVVARLRTGNAKNKVTWPYVPGKLLTQH